MPPGGQSIPIPNRSHPNVRRTHSEKTRPGSLPKGRRATYDLPEDQKALQRERVKQETRHGQALEPHQGREIVAGKMRSRGWLGQRDQKSARCPQTVDDCHTKMV